MQKSRNAGLLFLSIVLFYLLGYRILILMSLAEVDIPMYPLILISQGFIVIPGIIFLLITRCNPIRCIPYKKFKISNLLLVILFTYLMIPLISTISAISQLFSKNVMGQTLVTLSEEPFWINLIFIAMVPAIFEEFIFRGVMLHTMRNASIKYAIILSSIMFGLIHLNINQFCYTVFLGIFFGLLVEGTGSMFSAMTAHLVINGNSVILLALVNKLTAKLSQLETGQSLDYSKELPTQQTLWGIGIGAILSIGSTTLAVLIFIYICKRCNRWEHMKSIFKSQKREKMITFPFIIAAVICVGYMIVSEILR